MDSLQLHYKFGDLMFGQVNDYVADYAGSDAYDNVLLLHWTLVFIDLALLCSRNVISDSYVATRHNDSACQRLKKIVFDHCPMPHELMPPISHAMYCTLGSPSMLDTTSMCFASNRKTPTPDVSCAIPPCADEARESRLVWLMMQRSFSTPYRYRIYFETETMFSKGLYPNW